MEELKPCPFYERMEIVLLLWMYHYYAKQTAKTHGTGEQTMSINDMDGGHNETD